MEMMEMLAALLPLSIQPRDIQLWPALSQVASSKREIQKQNAFQ